MDLKISSFWLGVMATGLALAYLLPNHYAPWSSFHAEALACIAIIIPCVWVLIQSRKSIRIYPSNIAIAFAIIICALQYVLGVIEFFGILWLDMSYLFGLLVVLHVGDVWQRQRPGQALNYLAYAFLIAAIASLPIQAFQWIGMQAENPLLMNVQNVQRPFANIAQPNLLADLYLLSLIGISWLLNQHRKYQYLAFVLALLMLLGVALTGSRAGWTNVVILAAITIHRSSKDNISITRKKIVALLIFFLIFVVTMPMIQKVILETQEQPIAQYTNASLLGRINVWKMMISASLFSPWWGFGWGQTIKTNFIFEDSRGVDRGLFNQSHNVFLDFILWVGYPLAIVFTFNLMWYLFKLMKKKDNQLILHVQMMVAIFAVHSLVEFPLYYMYFLLPLGLMLGSVQSQIFEKPVIELRSKYSVIIIGIAITMTALTIRDYFLVEKSYYALRYESRGYLTDIKREPPNALVITQMVEHLRFSRSDDSRSNNPDDFVYMERVVRLTPGAYIMFKLALNYGLSGNTENSKFWLKQICEKVEVSQCAYAKEKWRAAILKYGEKKLNALATSVSVSAS